MIASAAYVERDGSEFTEYDGFAVEYRDASHRYWITKDSERKPAVSVTGALKILDKPALLQWAERAGAEGAAELARMGELDGCPPGEVIDRVRLFKLGMDAKRDAGAERGTIVHRVLEAYGRDGTVPNVGDFEPQIRGYVQGLCKWLLKANPEPVAIEQVVGSPTHWYAGRADLVANIGGLTYLCDLKTNPSGRVYDEAHVQAAAYQLALEECGIPTLGAVLVAVGEDGTFEEVPCCADPLDFLSVLDTHRRMGRIKSDGVARRKAA
jgi:hypothetical protein